MEQVQRSPGLMVSIAAGLECRLLLAFIDHNVKISASVYTEMLENHFLGPLLAHPVLAEHGLWQEDNAPAHRSREAMAWKEANWMKELKPQWPANSPDLSPLDYGIWTLVEGRLEHKVYPSKVALKVAITKAVNELNSDEHWP
eukprot:4713008-Amphidinium_carterae.1